MISSVLPESSSFSPTSPPAASSRRTAAVVTSCRRGDFLPTTQRPRPKLYTPLIGIRASLEQHLDLCILTGKDCEVQRGPDALFRCASDGRRGDFHG